MEIKVHYLQRYKHLAKAASLYREQLVHKNLVLKIGQQRAEELQQAELCEHQIQVSMNLEPLKSEVENES